MFLSVDVISLLLYCAQQLGVTLGVGAQTIMLIAYLSAMRDGVIDAKEAQFARAVRIVLNAGLILIIVSGIGIVAMHVLVGQSAVVLSAPFLFKWILVLAVLAFTLLKNLPQHVMQGLAGGTWYALFVVHILAPITGWANLSILYAVWMAGFGLCWVVLVFATKDKKISATSAPKSVVKVAPPVPKPTPPPPKPVPPPVVKPVAPPPPPKPVVPPPAPPKPSPPAPAVAKVPPAPVPMLEQKHILQTLPQPEIAKPSQPQQVPVVGKMGEQNPWLPAIQIMPKTADAAQKQNPNSQPPAK